MLDVDGRTLSLRALDTSGAPIAGTEVSITKMVPVPFRRGDANEDGQVTGQVTDRNFIFQWIFQGGSKPHCMDAADVDDSGGVNLTDGIYLLNFNFLAGPPPPAPGPLACGIDPTPDGLDCLEYLTDC